MLLLYRTEKGNGRGAEVPFGSLGILIRISIKIIIYFLSCIKNTSVELIFFHLFFSYTLLAS